MESLNKANQFDKPFRFEDQEDAQTTKLTDEKIAKLNPRELLEDINLGSSSPHMPCIEEALKTLEQKQNHNHIDQVFEEDIDQVFEEALKDFEHLKNFERLKNPMMSYKCDFAKTTFQHVFSVFQDKSELSKLNSENERLSKINKFKNSSGAEPGFCSGNTPSQVENEITRKMQIALIAYQKAKQKDLLKEFVEAISNGDRCLTARFGRIEDFLASKLVGFDLEEETRKDAILMLSDGAISQALWDIANNGDCDSINPDMLLESKKHIQTLANWFKKLENTPTAKPFRKFLENQGLVVSSDKINWKEIMPSLVKAPFFHECLARGKYIFGQQQGF